MTRGLIIIPAYNEGKNIGRVLGDMLRREPELDVLVVDDGSRDDTAELAKIFGVALVSHAVNLGYGAALQTGFRYAVKNGYDYVIQFDADGQHDPDYLRAVKAEIEKGEADIVIGSRFLCDSEYKVEFFKSAAIRLMSFTIKRLTGCRVTDPTSGFKALSRRTFRYYALAGNFPSDYPDANILIKMLRKNYRVVEIPVNIRKRICGTTMHSGLKPLFYIFDIFLSIFVILLRETFVKEN